MASTRLLVFLSVLSSVSVVVNPAVVSDVDAVVNAGLGCHDTPGLAVAIVKDGKVVMSRGYGVTSTASKRPVTNTTLFDIASLSKAFTATLLSKILHDDGRYSINTNVYQIVGKHKFNNTLRSVYATVEDLMAHRMGIPRNNYIRLDDTLTRDNLVERVKFLPSVGGFRDSFYYSDLMYGILTHITETIGGKAWEDSMIEKIFKPLHMDSSTFGTRTDFSSSSVASPYVKESGHLKDASTTFIRHWAMIGGSGSVVSSADDMSKWMLFHLSGGKNQEGVQVVEENLVKETHKPRNAISSYSNKYFRRPKTPVTMSNDGYGLGWKTGYYRGLPIVQHSGSTFGYRSYLTLIPDKNIGVFVTMTGTDPEYLLRGSLSAYLMDVTLGETPWINSSTICTFPSPWFSSSRRRRSGRRRKARKTQRASNANHALSSYAGVYRNEAYGNIDVHYDSSSHKLQATYGIASWDLSPRGGDKFRATWDKQAPSLNFYFEFTASGSHVFKLTPSFESSSPPLFYRVGHSSQIIG